MPKTIPVPFNIREEVKRVASRNPKTSFRQLGKEFGVHHTTVAKILAESPSGRIHVDSTGKPELTEVSEVAGDNWTISLPKTRIHTLEELIEFCKVDLSIWEAEKFTCNKYEMGYTVGEGKDKTADSISLFQVKAFLKKKKNVESAIKEISELKELAKNHPWPVSSTTILPSSPSGLMLEVNIPDLHVGKLAWSPETGGPNYDVKIAESIFWKSLNTLLSRVSGYKFDQVLFVLGNDMLNSDDIEGRTTAGTYVSTDARFHKTFSTVRTMTIQAVEHLKQIAPVKIVPVYGNHDRLSSWHLADSVEMYFHNDFTVSVDNRPRTRKYHQHGKVMLCFTHGDKGKKNDYPLVMATEEPKMFGDTIYRECHTGHTHMTKLDEQHGVRVRVLPALCPADDWHSQNGFVGNKRSAEAYVWDKEEGLISLVFHTEQD